MTNKLKFCGPNYREYSKFSLPSWSGGLAQNFPPAMVSLRGPYYLLTRKDSNVFRQKGPFFSKKGPFLHDFEPVGQSATAGGKVPSEQKTGAVRESRVSKIARTQNANADGSI